ncbi:hypothetical protein GGR50DRAFT_686260 [Xylaria sp. CBS 124048]|nr:hypothetical protein GGR50DRAFT_686260 [Xylaria sp. CBS 124048]
MTVSPVRPPDIQQTVGPLIPSLRAAAVSLQPPETVLALLTPILQQRVQLLSFSSTNDPWIRLLCYEVSKVPKLTEIALGEKLEPHPVSGELEIDWDCDAETRFRRLDEETLQALVILKELGLAFRLVHCEGDGWKVGEVTVADSPSPFFAFGGVSTIAEAERQFNELNQPKAEEEAISARNGLSNTHSGQKLGPEEDSDDDDDGYWALYDTTPGAKTPITKKSPAPRVTQNWNSSNENDYFDQYNDVQPVMDNHDPDEDVNINVSPPLGLGSEAVDATSNGHGYGEPAQNGTSSIWTLGDPLVSGPSRSRGYRESDLLQPNPRSASSASSNRSVEKLEAAAARQEKSSFGVQQHISRSIRSLFLLSQASGIDREEFERLVKTELDTLGLIDD